MEVYSINSAVLQMSYFHCANDPGRVFICSYGKEPLNFSQPAPCFVPTRHHQRQISNVSRRRIFHLLLPPFLPPSLPGGAAPLPGSSDLLPLPPAC